MTDKMLYFFRKTMQNYKVRKEFRQILEIFCKICQNFEILHKFKENFAKSQFRSSISNFANNSHIWFIFRNYSPFIPISQISQAQKNAITKINIYLKNFLSFRYLLSFFIIKKFQVSLRFGQSQKNLQYIHFKRV